MLNQGFRLIGYKRLILVFTLLIAITFGCKNAIDKKDSVKSSDSISETKNTNSVNGNTLYKFNNVVFSVPSPYEFAFFVKNLGITFNKEYLNPANRVSSYSSSFKKAINLGVYGSDLGYLTIYDQTPDAVAYFSTLKILSKEIGITSVFGQNTMSKFEKNMGNKDSLMYLLSTSYRDADAYLKDNERKSTAALILAGSWIESQYILTQIAKTMPVKEVYKKIAEQKHPLDNLIKILSIYYNQNKDDKDFVAMTEILVNLAYEYDGIDYQYEYKKPKHSPKNNFTVIESVSELQINPEQVKAITKLTEKLRSTIVKN